MAVIRPKIKSDIKAGINYHYVPATFAEHKVDNFYETTDPQVILDNIVPMDFHGMKVIFVDTETYAEKLDNHDIPTHMVRRWIGSGKKALPQDFPFCLTICDGTKSYALYDTLENGFKNFKAVSPLLLDRSVDKCFHNAKFDMHMIQNIGMKIAGKIHDTVVIMKITDENRTSFKLKDVAAQVPKGIPKFEYMVDSYKKQYKIGDYRQIPRELMTQYTNADTWNCCQVFINEYPKLIEDNQLDLYDTELKNIIALYAMERHGMRTDREYEPAIKNSLHDAMVESEQAIYETAGKMFNINSGKQLYQVLLDLGTDPKLIKMTDKGNPTLDKKALNTLAEKHNVDIAKKIVAFRQNEHFYNTYAVGIYDQIDSVDKVHANINQTEATTGRMSIVKPALQTLPKKDKRIRKCFIPVKDFVLAFLDLDQVEYRFFAHYAKATALIELIKQGLDVHTATGTLIYNIAYEQVVDTLRDRAKTMNFALIYGMGQEALAAALGLTLSQAIDFKQKYFAAIPEAEPFIREVQNVTKSRGYIRNYYNRRRRLNYDEVYKACNALIQGCAADYLKDKIATLYAFLTGSRCLTRMVIVVHDELGFEVHDSELHLLPKLRHIMSDFTTFRAPITAGVDLGNPSWGEKIEYGNDFEPPTEEDLAIIASFDFWDGHVFDKELYAA